MSRYIDADELKEFISKHDYTLSDMYNSKDKGMFTCGIFQAINEQSTADVRENVRGEWSKYKDPYDAEPIVQWKCNKCNMLERKKSNFCPNCGADTRGEENENQYGDQKAEEVL